MLSRVSVYSVLRAKHETAFGLPWCPLLIFCALYILVVIRSCLNLLELVSCDLRMMYFIFLDPWDTFFVLSFQ